MRRFFIMGLTTLLLSSCDDMNHQPRYDSYERSPLFADGKALQAPPAGTLARDDVLNGEALANRPTMSPELLQRGQVEFGIYCTPCHDAAGYGNGTVPARGFPHPPSFHIDRLRSAPSRYFVEVISNGHGVMYAYADRISPQDRWAVAAYIRALQFSQNADPAALPPQDRARIEKARS
ncbi:cytochrome c [Rhizobium sp. P40RR-XXII]|uniref:c-type cytochrome n=1 Tax=Rhizobium sp. P40RR-XXII TaxID=2726739 RepID=UPI0014576880|nr:cytochrome c [Rhizobium sp. P40RR-XXII]NLS17665.1 cytochrome c [Rhizobium sp. P40RR-XXII]